MKTVDKLVPDTSVVIEGIISKQIVAKELKPKIIIFHEAVMAELEAQANRGRETGLLGLEEVKKLREMSKKYKFAVEFKGNRPGDFEIRRAKAGEIDSIIRRLAIDELGTLITADRVQALVAESKGVEVIFYDFRKTESDEELVLAQYFDETTMSVHLKDGCVAKAKKGKPGAWTYEEIGDAPLTGMDVSQIAKKITEECASRSDGFIEIDRKGSTIIQLVNYRIVITRPPFADGYEITAVRPVKRLTIEEYSLSDKLKLRVGGQAEGILIAGAPGNGKTTFAQALAESYVEQNKVVKTVEAPRDLILPPDVTQYSLSHGSSQEIHDILLLSRPDYTIFDEMRNTEDFRLFSDMRLSGVGMIGVMHATKAIDAIQRFIGRIELGVIPHIVDTVIFIKDGGIGNVFSLSMEVKVPSGMIEQDLARPVVVINDFLTGKLEYEIYTFGEQTVVIPVSGDGAKAPAHSLAEDAIVREFKKHTDKVKVDVVSNNKCIVYVLDKDRAAIIGKGGSNIEKLEKKLRMSIDIRDYEESTGVEPSNKSTIAESINFTSKIHNTNVVFMLPTEYAEDDVDVYVEGEYTLTARSSRKAIIKIAKKNKVGKLILEAVKYKEFIELKRTIHSE